VLLAGRGQKVLLVGCVIIIALLAPPARGTELKPQTVAAFDEYVRLTEGRMVDDVAKNRFLAVIAVGYLSRLLNNTRKAVTDPGSYRPAQIPQ
jgi:hypothetical protein